MTSFKTLTIWTIVLNFFIIIGAGHGVACIGLFEVAALFHGFGIGLENFTLSPTANYDRSLSAVSLFALPGQLFLIVSLLVKDFKKIMLTKIVGMALLWISFFYLTHNLFYDELSQLGFFTGLPFLICSFILTYRITKDNLQTP